MRKPNHMYPWGFVSPPLLRLMKDAVCLFVCLPSPSTISPLEGSDRRMVCPSYTSSECTCQPNDRCRHHKKNNKEAKIETEAGRAGKKGR
ncbi:hypothetical protein P170DRAFT_103017 [Aspergillus steynii IBT 23096]|uniref:Uncharacterized protein n=1 Tax=Aspergillus steynii IBT 23096 TaxID=1392250 RepID=A0A2I2GHN6_9EURO|nr:uncharacterized protein P170DRAFT_103017 [Aspergillus steynii IBT 23096]PLB52396.1 hypothetical protein P170DRAFT_103017 [Aspergillus steynii IBT 23096]